MGNLHEKVRKSFCYQKLFWPFTVWINCSSDLKNFANSQPSTSNFKSFSQRLEQFFLTVGQNNFDNKIPYLYLAIISRNFITKKIARKQKINELSLYYRRKSGQSQRSESNWIIEKELEKSGHGQFRTTIKWNTVVDFAWFCSENIRSFCLLNQWKLIEFQHMFLSFAT